MTYTAAAGQDDGTGTDPDIASNVQRSGCRAALMPHRDIRTVIIVPSAEEKDVLPHHQVIINRDNPVERLEVLPDPHFVPDGEVFPTAEVCTSLYNQLTALVSLILPEHVPANRPADKCRQPAENRHRRLR